MSRVDLAWLGQPCRQTGRLRPPGIHLHLGNFVARIDEDAPVMLNSPRSAVVLLRKGVPVQSLLRRPWARKRFTHTSSFGAIDTLKIDEKKEFALERLRQDRLTELVAEYHELCAVSDHDDVSEACRQLVETQRRLQQGTEQRAVGTSAGMGRPSSAMSRVSMNRPVSAMSRANLSRPASAMLGMSSISSVSAIAPPPQWSSPSNTTRSSAARW